jgi:polysaccharide biosynthesis protein PslH
MSQLGHALFLTTVLPRKKRMGSEVASQAIIDQLRALGYRVTVAGYVRNGDKYDVEADEVCIDLREIESAGAGLNVFRWLARSLFNGTPYSIEKYVSTQYVRAVEQLLRGKKFDFVIVDHVQTSWLIKEINFSAKIIGIAHNVEYEMYASFVEEGDRLIKRKLYARESRLIQRAEKDFVNSVDQLWVLTSNDRRVFSSWGVEASVVEIPLPASKIRNCSISTKKTFDVALIGSWTWKANEQGLRWFFAEVYPFLPPDLEIRVAGSGADWLIDRFNNVVYEGFVKDAMDFLCNARVIAIPTLSGGGIQIKSLDAIATGVPIVATALAMRGIEKAPKSVVVFDNPKEFSAKLVEFSKQSDSIEESSTEAQNWTVSRHSDFGLIIRSSLSTLNFSVVG